MFGWISRARRRSNAQPTAVSAGRAKSQPPDGDAAQLKQRGKALLAQSRFEPATECYRHAAALDAQDVDSRVNFGFALSEQGLFAQAEGPLRQAIELRPDSVDAHYLLAIALREQGQLTPAIEHARRTLALQPGFALCRRDLCRLLVDSGQAQAARDVVTQGLALDAGDADLHHYLGNLQTTAKEYEAAIVSFERALAIQSGDALVLTNLGFALHRHGLLDAALATQQMALTIRPDLAEAHFNLGAVQQARGLLREAEQSFRQALALRPEYVDPYVHLGAVLHAQGRFDDGAVSLNAALALAPQSVEAHANLATLLLDQGRAEAAIEHLQAALRTNAASPQVHCNLGAAFQRLGQLDDAVEHYRKAVELDPEFLDAHSNLLFVLSFDPGCSPGDYLAEARRYGEKLSVRARPYADWPMSDAAGRRPALRVGLVSGDLKSHPVGYFIESLLRNLDPARFDLVAYPTQPREDDLSARVKPFFSAWTPVHGLTDEEAAKRIHNDGIDILIDLAGHSAHNRLPMFAWRPAPVQLSWLGYFASTGAPGIDWLIADPVSVPEYHRAHFSERICYVPDTRLCFTPPHETSALAVSPLPALSKGHLTFGCFQVSSKINSGVLAAWAEIFGAVPGALLRVQNQEMHSSAARAALHARLNKVGIATERVTLVGSMSRDEYLAAHANVDIILDTFPFPGGTTTCEALWMGVPTLTLAGESMLALQGASLLACAGLADWVAGSPAEYVERALAFAADHDGLARLRRRLRQQVLASPLFDAPGFSRHLEAALNGLWVRHAADLDGEH
jgi:protein O-GlcNAc transferase